MNRSYRTKFHPPLIAFVAAVVVAGSAAAVFTLAAHPPAIGLRVLAFSVAAALAELVYVQIDGRRERQEITTSTAFVIAALLIDGVAAAVVVQTIAAVVGDSSKRRRPVKAAFNVSQKALSICIYGGVLSALGGTAPVAPQEFGAGTLAAIAIASGAHYLVNTSLVLIAMGLAERVPLTTFLRAEIPRQPATPLLVLGVAPLIAAATGPNLLLLPVFAVPVWALWRSGRQAVATARHARHDALTDLPNRSMLELMLTSELAVGPVSLLLIDLDAFTEVNDTVGHRHGDTLLLAVAARLAGSLPPDAALARPSGDEFAVVLPGPAAEALALGEQLAAGFEQPFHLDGLELELGVSVGVADAPRAGGDAVSLLSAAARALAAAKGERGAVRLFDAPRDAAARGRLVLLTELRRGVRDDEVVAYFQPQVDLRTGRVCAAEALVRWQRSDGSVTPPGLFIPHAEQTGLMRPLTISVLEQALAAHAAWAAGGLELSVAINVSARSLLDARLVADVSEALERSGVAPEFLELELTESAMMAEPNRARVVLEELSSMGVRVAIDDFGTGYSSLAYLGRLPVSTVKIDRAFVAGLSRDPADAIIVRSTIDLGHNLGLRVVAEGVEDAETRDMLQALGCDLAQGFLWSPAVPVAQLTTSVRNDLNLAA